MSTSVPGAGDPYAGRPPSSHERMSGRPWDASYHDEAPAPWDIGGPQPAIARLAAEGAFTGRVLDAGCGSGENALLVAGLGRSVVGVDVAATAVVVAREKAVERAVDAEFVVGDAFDLAALGRRFDTVVDSGLFHACDREERARYAASLATVTAPGGTVYVLCFSDQGTGSEVGPHPVSRDDLAAAFTVDRGWTVVSVEPDRVRTRFHDDEGAAAWLATIRRT